VSGKKNSRRKEQVLCESSGYVRRNYLRYKYNTEVKIKYLCTRRDPMLLAEP